MTLLAGAWPPSRSILLVAFRGDRRRALVPLVPIVLATGWSALVLFALRIPLNPMSVTLGALVIAISTEFSVLLSERHRQERAAGHSTRCRRCVAPIATPAPPSPPRASPRSPASACWRCRTSRCCATSGSSRSSISPCRCSGCSSRCRRRGARRKRAAAASARRGDDALAVAVRASRRRGLPRHELRLAERSTERPAVTLGSPVPLRRSTVADLAALCSSRSPCTSRSASTKAAPASIPPGTHIPPFAAAAMRSADPRRSRRRNPRQRRARRARCRRARSEGRASSTSASSTNGARWCSRCSSTPAPARGPRAICSGSLLVSAGAASRRSRSKKTRAAARVWCAPSA